jgi:hypothetical protein
MAPGTNIGAAHPISFGGAPLPATNADKDKDAAAKPAQDILSEKITNDAVAWARALADYLIVVRHMICGKSHVGDSRHEKEIKMKCILNVTDHEYNKILQLTHDAVEWSNTDLGALERLETLLGSGVVAAISRYEECRMEKHHDISGLPRVTPARDLSELIETGSTSRV